MNCFACMKLDSLNEAKAEMEKRLDDDLYLAIALKESGKVIGEIFEHPEGTAPEDETMDTFSPCWMLNHDYQGKGYAYFHVFSISFLVMFSSRRKSSPE